MHGNKFFLLHFFNNKLSDYWLVYFYVNSWYWLHFHQLFIFKNVSVEGLLADSCQAEILCFKDVPISFTAHTFCAARDT